MTDFLLDNVRIICGIVAALLVLRAFGWWRKSRFLRLLRSDSFEQWKSEMQGLACSKDESIKEKE